MFQQPFMESVIRNMSIDTEFTTRPWPTSILVIGCGLMGSSFALAVQAARPTTVIAGVEPFEQHREQLRSAGAFNTVYSTLGRALGESTPDLIVIATPIDAAVTLLRTLEPVPSVIMDICSVKVPICAEAAALHLEQRFAPTHPMAGMATEGPTHASAALFVDKPWILVRDWPACDRLLPLMRDLGARPVYVSTPHSHDEAMAAVSHTVHLVSLAAMQAFDDSQSERGADWRLLTGPGFRDVTRLSGASPGFWVSTLLSNAPAVNRQLERVIQSLSAYQLALESQDQEGLHHLLDSANQAFRKWKDGQDGITKRSENS